MRGGKDMLGFQPLSAVGVLARFQAATLHIHLAGLAGTAGIVAIAIEGFGMVVINALVQPFLGGLETLSRSG